MPPLPDHPTSPRLVSVHGATLWLAVVGTLSMLACEEDKAPTAPPNLEAQAAAIAPAVVGGITPQGTIPLPVNQTFNAAALAFGITQTGTGPSGSFKINKAANSANALLGQTNGSGIAVRGLATSATGRAGSFEITNAANGNNALTVSTNGPGIALSAGNTGTGPAGVFFKTGAGSSAALIASNNGSGLAVQGRATGEGQERPQTRVRVRPPTPLHALRGVPLHPGD